MPMLPSEALLDLHEIKSVDKILPPVGIEPRPLMNLCFQVQHSPFYTNLTCAALEILNFCSCTTQYLDDDLRRINRA